MAAAASENSTSRGLSHLAGKYLSFALAGEKYGLEILKVQEIIGVLHITKVPRSPDYLKGVINLRGKIIPVVDLRLKFGLPDIEYNERTCIIVVNTRVAGRHLQVGVVVDTVLEVLTFQGQNIEPSPDYGVNLETKFVLGMGRTSEDHIIILIDIEKALADSACTALLEAETAAAAGNEAH
jgi:purine-binding chemotaxis protein CheW